MAALPILSLSPLRRHATTRPLGNYFVGVVGDTQLFRLQGCCAGWSPMHSPACIICQPKSVCRQREAKA